MFELVIFDCDGVLVDSEIISNTVFAKMLGELGLPLSLKDTIEIFMGKSMSQCLDIMTLILGHPPPANFEENYHQRVDTGFKNGLRPVEGVPEMLRHMKLPYCVASSGSNEKMRTTLGITGLLPLFTDRLYSATQVAQGKPAPEIFLYAASQCGVEPRKCAVVEDTPTGVVAGVAAGMTVFGYSGMIPTTRLRQAGAHYIFKHMHELNRLLNQEAI
ncbi:MAG: HAD family hydrolase [Gammaproteobacteria bacterium]